MIQLGSTQRAVLDLGATDPLSFHCQEREVNAALWNQPHAEPSALGTTWPRAYAQATCINSWLGTGRPANSNQNPTSWAGPESHHNNAPTQVTGSRYQARRTIISHKCVIKRRSLFLLSNVGLRYVLVLGNSREMGHNVLSPPSPSSRLRSKSTKS